MIQPDNSKIICDPTSIIVVNGTTYLVTAESDRQWVKNQDYFTVYMCVDGDFQLTVDDEDYTYKRGDTVLIPAALTDFQLSGKASILEIYIS